MFKPLPGPVCLSLLIVGTYFSEFSEEVLKLLMWIIKHNILLT